MYDKINIFRSLKVNMTDEPPNTQQNFVYHALWGQDPEGSAVFKLALWVDQGPELQCLLKV